MDKNPQKPDSLFGAWSGEETADDILKGIKDDRSTNREIEDF